MENWHLRVRTWSGITFNAYHYYGFLQDDEFEHDSIELKNKEGSIRFETRDELIEKAIKVWDEMKIVGVLFKGDPIIYDNREVLARREA